MRAPRKKGERGNAFIEFALSIGVLVAVMAGVFQYGYTFYVYNELQSSVRSAARYASIRPYFAESAACVTTTVDSVRNIAVYGSPVPSDSPVPIVRGLTKAKVLVDYNPDAKGTPTFVEVRISNFTVDAVFGSFTFIGKPYAAVPFVGRYAPNECN